MNFKLFIEATSNLYNFLKEFGAISQGRGYYGIQFPNKVIVIFKASRNSNDLEVNRIWVPPALRNRGLASALLKKITTLADKHKVRLIGTIDPEHAVEDEENEAYDLGVRELANWYSKYGFKHSLPPTEFSPARLNMQRDPNEL